jgi:hypothetical protein
MKKVIYMLLYIFVSFNIISQELNYDFKKVVKGEEAPDDGWWVSETKMQKIVKEGKELKIYREMFAIDTTDDRIYGNLIKAYDEKIKLMENQKELYKQQTKEYQELLESYKKENKNLKNANTVLIITNVIGWGLFVSETTGLSVGLYMKYNLP